MKNLNVIIVIPKLVIYFIVKSEVFLMNRFYDEIYAQLEYFAEFDEKSNVKVCIIASEVIFKRFSK